MIKRGINKVSDLEKKIANIQKSTRTSMHFFVGLNDWIRLRSRAYYNWHLNPNANKIHVSGLFIYVFLILGLIITSFYPQQKIMAANHSKTWTTTADFNSGTKSNVNVANDQIRLATSQSNYTENFATDSFKDASTTANWDTVNNYLKANGTSSATVNELKFWDDVFPNDYTEIMYIDHENGILYLSGTAGSFLAYNLNTAVTYNLSEKLGIKNNNYGFGSLCNFKLDTTNNNLFYLVSSDNSNEVKFGSMQLTNNPATAEYVDLTDTLNFYPINNRPEDMIIDQQNKMIYIFSLQERYFNVFDYSTVVEDGAFHQISSNLFEICDQYNTGLVFNTYIDSYNNVYINIGMEGEIGMFFPVSITFCSNGSYNINIDVMQISAFLTFGRSGKIYFITNAINFDNFSLSTKVYASDENSNPSNLVLQEIYSSDAFCIFDVFEINDNFVLSGMGIDNDSTYLEMIQDDDQYTISIKTEKYSFVDTPFFAYIEDYFGVIYALDTFSVLQINFGGFNDSSAKSKKLNELDRNIQSATISADAETPSGTSINYYLSNNGGEDWEETSVGVEHFFSTTGSDLRWRADINAQGENSPVINDLSVSYNYFSNTSGSWNAKFNAGSTVTWNSVIWDKNLYSGTSMTAKFRSASTELGLNSATWSNNVSITGSGYNLANLNVGQNKGLSNNQWVEVQVSFSTDNLSYSPKLNSLMLNYSDALTIDHYSVVCNEEYSVDTGFSLQIKAYDANNNLINTDSSTNLNISSTGNLKFYKDDKYKKEVSSYKLSNGIATVYAKSAIEEDVKIMVNDSNGKTGESGTIRIKSGYLFSLDIPTEVIAGEKFKVDLGSSGSFDQNKLTLGGLDKSKNGDDPIYGAVVFNNGIANVEIVAYKSGDDDLVVLYDGREVLKSKINVKSSQLKEVVINSELEPKAGDNIDINSQLKDGYGNQVSDVTLIWNGAVNGKFSKNKIGKYNVFAYSGDIKSNTLEISVLPGKLEKVILDPDENLKYGPGSSVEYTAMGYDKYDNLIKDVSYEWFGTDGKNTGKISRKDLGIYNVYAKGSFGGKSITSKEYDVTVTNSINLSNLLEKDVLSVNTINIDNNDEKVSEVVDTLPGVSLNLNIGKTNKEVSKIEAKLGEEDIQFDPGLTGEFVAKITSPRQPGKYEVKVKIFYKDGTTEEKIIEVLVDPYGYVYEDGKKGEQRLSNVEVTCYQKEGDNWKQWDAKKYNQINPQLTEDNGEYSFMVPEGIYYIEAKKEGYEVFKSNDLKVEKNKPVNLNIKLTKKPFSEKIIESLNSKDGINLKIATSLLFLLAIYLAVNKYLLGKKVRRHK